MPVPTHTLTSRRRLARALLLLRSHANVLTQSSSQKGGPLQDAAGGAGLGLHHGRLLRRDLQRAGPSVRLKAKNLV